MPLETGGKSQSGPCLRTLKVLSVFPLPFFLALSWELTSAHLCFPQRLGALLSKQNFWMESVGHRKAVQSCQLPFLAPGVTQSKPADASVMLLGILAW